MLLAPTIDQFNRATELPTRRVLTLENHPALLPILSLMSGTPDVVFEVGRLVVLGLVPPLLMYN